MAALRIFLFDQFEFDGPIIKPRKYLMFDLSSWVCTNISATHKFVSLFLMLKTFKPFSIKFAGVLVKGILATRHEFEAYHLDTVRKNKT